MAWRFSDGDPYEFHDVFAPGRQKASTSIGDFALESLLTRAAVGVAMEVHLTPDLEKKLNDLAAQSGRPAGDLAQDAIAGYVDDLCEQRPTSQE